MSEFKIEIVPIKLEIHPNADSLSIVHVGKYQVVVRTEDWKDKTEGIYIPPDSVVKNIEPFKFLFKPNDGSDKEYRITAKRFRQYISMGLLVPICFGLTNNDDIAEMLQIKHWNLPLELSTSGECISPPKLYIPIYDVESWYNYPDVFEENEPIYVTEKLHGCQGRFVFHDNEIFCGSKREWKKSDQKNVWWQSLKRHPEIEKFLKENPDTVVYGEIFGDVQDLKYGREKGEVSIRIFDIYNMKGDNTFLNYYELVQTAIDNWLTLVPVLAVKKYDEDSLIAEGNSEVYGCENQIREGIVIKPVYEQYDPKVGRVILKKVSNEYYERRNK